MNILYVSKLDGRPWAGPTYSVPKQIEAQSKHDNILWYNLCAEGVEDGKENLQEWRTLKYYVDKLDYPSSSIKDLPPPFDNPDLIVIEQGYPFALEKIRFEIMKSSIPYIIVPRGELTIKAQSKKRLKKLVGNIVLAYPKFTKKALAIHCLSEQEKKETSNKWNKKKIVLPNGTDLPECEKEITKDRNIKCVYIGRLEPYQKGLDMLIEACKSIQNDLEESGVHFSFYGSNIEHKLENLKQQVIEYGLTNLITFHDGVYGMEKKEILLNSDVFIMTSRFEGQPMGLLEALSYGLPCLVTTGTNMRNEIEAQNAGWGADNNVKSIKKALLDMIASKIEYPEKGSNARALSKEYEWNNIARRTHTQYENLLKDRVI